MALEDLQQFPEGRRGIRWGVGDCAQHLGCPLCCSSASSRSRVSTATLVSVAAAGVLRRRTAFGAFRRFGVPFCGAARYSVAASHLPPGSGQGIVPLKLAYFEGPSGAPPHLVLCRPGQPAVDNHGRGERDDPRHLPKPKAGMRHNGSMAGVAASRCAQFAASPRLAFTVQPYL